MELVGCCDCGLHKRFKNLCLGRSPRTRFLVRFGKRLDSKHCFVDATGHSYAITATENGGGTDRDQKAVIFYKQSSSVYLPALSTTTCTRSIGQNIFSRQSGRFLLRLERAELRFADLGGPPEKKIFLWTKWSNMRWSFKIILTYATTVVLILL